MRSQDIHIILHHRPDRGVSIENRHNLLMARLAGIDPPLGLKGCSLPTSPDCGAELAATVAIKTGFKGLSSSATYLYRGEKYIWRDETIFDEHLTYQFRKAISQTQFRDLLNYSLSQIINAFEPYLLNVFLKDYCYKYEGGSSENNIEWKTLKEDNLINMNGRFFIYTLNTAQFWDGELCRRALGFDRDEVIRRVKDVALLAEPVLDGVYLVLNDDPNISYAAFVEMNARIKPLLGLTFGSDRSAAR